MGDVRPTSARGSRRRFEPVEPPLRATARSPPRRSASLLSYAAPTSNDPVTLGFKQSIGATQALRTGTYAKTLLFTLSTTTPQPTAASAAQTNDPAKGPRHVRGPSALTR